MKTPLSKDKNNSSSVSVANNRADNTRMVSNNIVSDSNVSAQLAAVQSRIQNSPLIVAQRRQIGVINGDGPAQLEGKKEEKKKIAQGKFIENQSDTTQLAANSEKNNTGLPDKLKSGVESLSGLSMNDVKVHYNSAKPAQLNALAYAQGNQIHIAPGQSKHLPHEAWHVAQQKQGRVKPTTQAKGVAINDDRGLEREADVMGAKAMQMKPKEEKKK